MSLGDKILISPDLTQSSGWVEGTIIEMEENSFVGTVISAQTPDGNIFFGRQESFRQSL